MYVILFFRQTKGSEHVEEFNWHSAAEDTWDGMAERWSSRSKNMWENGSRKDIVPFMKTHVHKGKVIDIGCGDGYGSHVLKRNGFDVVGVDISEEMIKRAHERKIDDSISFTQADVRHLPFSDEMFDAALVVNVVEWTEHPLHVLQELKRVLKPGGMICIGILGPTAGPRAHSYRRLYGEKVICNMVMPWEWQQMAEENGLTFIDGMIVPKQGMYDKDISHIPFELQQALSFMGVSIFKKEDE